MVCVDKSVYKAILLVDKLSNFCGFINNLILLYVKNVLLKSCYNYCMAYIRKFETTSGATGVQVCYKEGNRVVKTIHIGSASSEKSLERLVKKAQGIIDQEKGTPLFNLNRYDKK